MTTALWLDAPFAPISPGFDYWANLSTGGAVLNGRGSGGGGTPIADIFVVAGQSNAEGRGTAAQSPSSATGRLYSAGALTTLADPVGGANTGSAWPAFANEWTAVHGGTRIAVIAERAAGGTGLLPAAGGQWGPAGTLRAAVVTAAAEAVAAVTASTDYALGRVYVVWAQGENDAIVGVTPSEYASALQVLADYWNANIPNLFDIIVIQLSGLDDSRFGSYYASPTNFVQQRLRRGQQLACNAHEKLAMVSVDQDAARGLDQMKDATHWGQLALNRIGKYSARYAANGGLPAFAQAADPSPINVFAETLWSNRTTRTKSVAVASGIGTLVLVVSATRENNTPFSTTVTCDGVAMTQVHASEARGAAPLLTQNVSIFAITDVHFGSALAGATRSIVVEASAGCSAAHVAVLQFPGEYWLHSESKDESASSAVVTDSYRPAVAVYVSGESSMLTTAITHAWSAGVIEAMDASITDGVTSAGAAVAWKRFSASTLEDSVECTLSSSASRRVLAAVVFAPALPT